MTEEYLNGIIRKCDAYLATNHNDSIRQCAMKRGVTTY